MRTVIVGSTNPVKLTAVQAGFGAMFPRECFIFRGIDVPSGVSEQPQSDVETLQGAKQRAANAQEQVPEADFWVGIEGGVDSLPGNSETLLAFAWAVVLSAEQRGCARTGAFLLPEPVVELVRSGLELGEADDQVFGTQGSKQQNGAVGLLTHNALTRDEFYALSGAAGANSFYQSAALPRALRTRKQMTLEPEFWKKKRLEELNAEEWEALCDGCGKCCLFKLIRPGEDKVRFTNVTCRYMDLSTCRCTDYVHRNENVPECLIVTPELAREANWLPKTCAYRLVAHSQELPWWHPLRSGSAKSVILAGQSVLGKVVSEEDVDLDDLEDMVVDWFE